MKTITVRFTTEVTFLSEIEVDRKEFFQIANTNFIIKHWGITEERIYLKLLKNSKIEKVIPSIQINSFK